MHDFDSHQPGLESPPDRGPAITPAGSDFTEGRTRGINASEDTTATIRWAGDPETDVVGYQFHKGYNPGQFIRISAVTSGTLWALR